MSDGPDALLGHIRRCIQAGAVRVSSYGYDELAARLCSCRCSWKANLKPASSQAVRRAADVDDGRDRLAGRRQHARSAAVRRFHLADPSADAG